MWEFFSKGAKSAASADGSAGEEGDLATTSLPARSDSKLSAPLRRRVSLALRQAVNFKDVTVTQSNRGSVGEEDGDLEEGTGEGDDAMSGETTIAVKNKMVIIMVGLPARGKTFLCNKLRSYLNWLGHPTGHFNVGFYRRAQKGEGAQDASFFDQTNEAGMEARQRALHAALDDMLEWLAADKGQVAILDATNTTRARRQQLRDRLHNRCQYLFIESICTDSETLERNYRNKLLYSPDYTGVSEEDAIVDFKERVRKYEMVYEPIDDRTFHYIKLIDMVTGRGYLDINRISGYIPGKLVFFLMQVCKAGLGHTRKIWLTRHGESEYNRSDLLGGDSDISEAGQRYAEALPAVLMSRLPPGTVAPLQVWTSTLKRTIQTARHLPFPKLRWKALDEINAGSCDGMTYEQVREKMPAEYEARQADKLGYRYPAGESYLDVIQRLEPAIIEVERQKDSVCIVAHQAILRVIMGYFMHTPPEEIPRLSIPLHTLLELTPMPDGTMALEKIPIDINAQPHQLQRHLSEVAPSRWPLAMSVASRGMVPQPPASSSGAGPSATAFAIASSAAEVVAEADSTVSAASDTSAETAVEEADSSTSDADATQGGTTAAAAPARAHAAEGGPDVHDAQAVDVGESPESPASV